MHKKAFIIVLTGLMIFSSFAVLSSNLPVSAYAINTNPAISTAGYYNGNVIIHPDGSVTGTGSGQVPLVVVSGNVYSLTENVNGTVTDQMNGSTIQGNSLTVNGGSNTALIANNVTGITIEDIAVVNASEGVQFNQVYNSVINNITVNHTSAASMTMIHVYYSGNVTIENSNFLFGTVSTPSYGIDAEYDSSVNVSYNYFSGASNEYIVNSNIVGQLNAWGNSIMSTSGLPDGFYFQGGNAVFANNYVNNTEEAIYVYQAQSVASMNNYVSNSSNGFNIEYASSYVSYNDTAIFSEYPIELSYIGNATVQYGNFGNSTSYSYIGYNSNVTVAHSTFSSTLSQFVVYLEGGETVNMFNDQVNAGTGANVYAFYINEMSGQLNFANDYISAPNSYGLFFYDGSPQYNVVHSYFNTTYGIYATYSDSVFNVAGATISGNTFIGPTTNQAVYINTYDTQNINFSNNTVQSTGSTWAHYGIYVYSSYSSSNVSVAGNTFKNTSYPVYIESGFDNGYNVWIQNNIIVNSTDGIYAYTYANSVVTSNKIVNVTDEGIYVYANNPNTIVSSNLVENLPGFAGMSYGIDLEYLTGGNNIVSNNTVLTHSPSSNAIFVEYGYSVLVYSNTVNGGEYGIHLENNGPISAFGNVVNNAGYGIDSSSNNNFSYYGNTVNDANYSFKSYYDYAGSVFANTFSDSQANSSQLYFLDIQYSDGLTFYHNNFLNSTTNSSTYNYFYDNSPLTFYEPLPVGGNYWSNYTGTGTNGIGSTPMNLTGSIQDLYPLTGEWNSPVVTLVETGLPTGTEWSASLGGSLQSSSGASMVFNVADGKYMNVGYVISAVPGYTASVSSGTVYQNGNSKTVMVTFTPVKYAVTFKEIGLPAGTSWSVKVNGVTKISTSGTLTFSEANGTYDYTVNAVTGYNLQGSTGSVTVDQNTPLVTASYTAKQYTLTVLETGLPSGDNWTFSINGQNYTTNSTSLKVALTSGTYYVNATGPSGYTVNLQANNTTIDNSNTTFSLHFTQQTNTPAASTNNAGLVEGMGIGAAIAIVAGLASAVVFTGRYPWDWRKKN